MNVNLTIDWVGLGLLLGAIFIRSLSSSSPSSTASSSATASAIRAGSVVAGLGVRGWGHLVVALRGVVGLNGSVRAHLWVNESRLLAIILHLGLDRVGRGVALGGDAV